LAEDAPVHYRIRYKVCSLYTIPVKHINCTIVSIIYTVSYHLPTRTLRLADTQLLTVPRSRLVFADRGFYIAGPTRVEESIPLTVRSANSAGILHSID